MTTSSPLEPIRIRLEERPTAQTVFVGQNVIAELEENPTTGYLWKLEAEPEGAVRIVGASFIPTDAAVGASGKRTWTLQVDRGPRIRLAASLCRPWERTATPQQSVFAVLIVRE